MRASIRGRNLEILAIILLSALVAFSIFLLVRKLIKIYSDKCLDEYQRDLLDKHYNEVDNMYRQMRGWRHDYKNHIQTMKIHLQNGEYDLVENYLSNLSEDLSTVDTVLKTGNVMVDAILNSKLSLAKSKAIRIDATASVPSSVPILETDLCVIIGNLFDNAIEAAISLPEDKRYIRLYMGLFKGQLYLSITNSVGGKIKKENKTYFTTKGENHGFGLRRIDTIVAKYKGFINRQDEKDVFITEVMLPLS